jgi:hypothetical protein
LRDEKAEMNFRTPNFGLRRFIAAFSRSGRKSCVGGKSLRDEKAEMNFRTPKRLFLFLHPLQKLGKLRVLAQLLDRVVRAA